MNKLQFWVLNCLSIVLAVLLLGHYFLTQRNDQLAQDLDHDRAAINDARRLEPVLTQLANRMAAGSETDPRLQSILTKYSLSVTRETDGKKKDAP